MQDYIYDQFQAVGNDLLRLGLTTSHGGNMSIRHQGNLVATVHFAMLVRGHGDASKDAVGPAPFITTPCPLALSRHGISEVRCF